MDTFFEIIFEIIFEVVLEGSLELSMTKSIKVPLLLRILAVLFICVIFGGLCAVLFLAGIKNKQPLLVGIAIFIFVMMIVAFITKYREYRRK